MDLLNNPAAWGEERSRTVTWHDPSATALVGMTLPGKDYLNAMGDGSLPPSPIGQLMGMRELVAEHGDVRVLCTADESHDNPVGITHGGLLTTLLDSACALAVHSTLDAGITFATIELKVSFLRSVTKGDELHVHGWVTKPGRRVCFAEADVRTPEGAVVATASSSILLTDLRKG